MHFLKELPDLTKVPQEFEENQELKAPCELAQEISYTKEGLESYGQHLDATRMEQTVRADGFAENTRNLADIISHPRHGHNSGSKSHGLHP